MTKKTGRWDQLKWIWVISHGQCCVCCWKICSYDDNIFDQFVMQNQQSYWELSETCLRLLLVSDRVAEEVSCGNIIILDLFHCASLWQTIHWSGLSICVRAVLSLKSLCLLLLHGFVVLSACCLAELLWDALSCCKDLLVFTENQTKHLCSFTKKHCCALETLEPVMPFSPLLTFTNAEWLSLPKILQIFFLQYKPQIWNTSCLDLYYKIEIVFFHITNLFYYTNFNLNVSVSHAEWSFTLKYISLFLSFVVYFKS